MLFDRRQRLVQASSQTVFQVFASLGGERGWLCMNWAWRLRAQFDGLLGGVGLRQARPPTGDLRVNDIVDSWRVECVESGCLLRLRAEMKLPGRGWLEFATEPRSEGCSQLTQTAFLEPRGVGGWLYWHSFYPAHHLIFGGLLHRIAKIAESSSAS